MLFARLCLIVLLLGAAAAPAWAGTLPGPATLCQQDNLRAEETAAAEPAPDAFFEWVAQELRCLPDAALAAELDCRDNPEARFTPRPLDMEPRPGGRCDVRHGSRPRVHLRPRPRGGAWQVLWDAARWGPAGRLFRSLQAGDPALPVYTAAAPGPDSPTLLLPRADGPPRPSSFVFRLDRPPRSAAI